MNRLIQFGALLLMAAGGQIWITYWPKHYEANFPKVALGSSRNSAIQTMGRHPWKDEACGVYFGGAPADCKEELVYAHPLAPWFPQYWVIDLDADHIVISAVQLSSP